MTKTQTITNQQNKTHRNGNKQLKQENNENKNINKKATKGLHNITKQHRKETTH